MLEELSLSKGGGTGPAGPVFQEGSKYFSANQKSNAWLRIGLEYKPWNTLQIRRSSRLQRVKPSFEML